MAADPVTEYWAELLQRTPVTPDVMMQWRRMLDHGIEAWSRALGEVMGTDEFARLLGSSIEQWLAAQAPVTGNRAQLTTLTAQLVRIEERVRRLEALVEASAPERPRPRRRRR
jgi:hypothetical protein